MGDLITVVIPCREDESAQITLESLALQTFNSFDVIAIGDKRKGASWARNRGFEMAKTPYVLFSDNDIEWRPNALELLYKTLKKSKASYSYGAYEKGGRVVGDRAFDGEALKKQNYISTMSLIKTKDFPGFDENIHRLQDWDLWLTLLSQKKTGVYCGGVIFSTKPRKGISTGPVSYHEARAAIKEKHGI